MNSITIIALVVVVLLTIIILWLTLLAYNSCLKSYKMEVNQGKHDKEIYKEYHVKKKNKGGLVGIIFSYIALLALSGLFIVGLIYKINNQAITIKDKTALVIKSGSMSDFYNEDIARKYNYDRSLQFDIGDICIFQKIDANKELIIGQVYGYKHKNIIVIHRLVDINYQGYEFRGDNNSIADGYPIKRTNILYEYKGQKVKAIGCFILYAQSYFGLWSILGIMFVAISSEVTYHKITDINKKRDKLLKGVS